MAIKQNNNMFNPQNLIIIMTKEMKVTENMTQFYNGSVVAQDVIEN